MDKPQIEQQTGYERNANANGGGTSTPLVCLHDSRGPQWIGSYINSRDEVVGLYSAN